MKTDNEIAHELFMPLAGEENIANMTKQEAQRKNENLRAQGRQSCWLPLRPEQINTDSK